MGEIRIWCGCDAVPETAFFQYHRLLRTFHPQDPVITLAVGLCVVVGEGIGMLDVGAAASLIWTIGTPFDVEVVHEMADGTVIEKGIVLWTEIGTATANVIESATETEIAIANVRESV